MSKPDPLPVIDVVPVLKAVCSWCGATTRAGSEPVTHSICPSCADDQRALIRAKAAVRANEKAVEPYLLRWKAGRENGSAIRRGDPVGGDPPRQAAEIGRDLDRAQLSAAGETAGTSDPGLPFSVPSRLREFISSNWATLLLVGIVLALSALHTWSR